MSASVINQVFASLGPPAQALAGEQPADAENPVFDQIMKLIDPEPTAANGDPQGGKSLPQSGTGLPSASLELPPQPVETGEAVNLPVSAELADTPDLDTGAGPVVTAEPLTQLVVKSQGPVSDPIQGQAFPAEPVSLSPPPGGLKATAHSVADVTDSSKDVRDIPAERIPPEMVQARIAEKVAGARIEQGMQPTPISAPVVPAPATTPAPPAEQRNVGLRTALPASQASGVASAIAAARTATGPVAPPAGREIPEPAVSLEVQSQLTPAEGARASLAGLTSVPTPVDASATQALPASLQQLVGAPPRETQGLTGGGTNAPVLPEMTVSPRVPAWAEHMHGRLQFARAQGMELAELQLHPAELGKLEIQISTDNERASILIYAQNRMARELIEAEMPRLRELFQDAGIQLGHSDVSEQPLREHREQAGEPGFVAGDSVDGDDAGGADLVAARQVDVQGSSLIDYYV